MNNTLYQRVRIRAKKGEYPMTVALAAVSQQTGTTRVRLQTSVAPEQELEFAKAIDGFIVGQPRAKRALRRAYRRYLDPMRDKRKPIYSMINVGPSRTGKTLSAEALAMFFHKDPECLLRINGGDYMEKEFLAQLTGSRPTLIGYVAPKEMVAADEYTKDPYAEFSQHNLFRYARRGSTEKITIVLIDEWEKACIEFNNVLLAILDSGKLTLGNGVVVDFRNVIFVFTSNLGMQELEKRGIGFGAEKQKTRQDIESIVGRHMKERTAPEFRNRIKENGEVVVFDFLTEPEMYEVVERELTKAQNRLIGEDAPNIKLVVDDASKRFLLERALEGEDGNISRLKDVLQAELLDKIGGELIKRTLRKYDSVEVVYEGDEELELYRVPNGALLLGAQAEGESEATAAVAVPTTTPGVTPPVVQLSPSGALVIPGPLTIGLNGIMMSEMLFLQKAYEHKLNAQLFPDLRARYHVTLTRRTIEELFSVAPQLVHELTETLGVQLIESQSTYQPQCSVDLLVLALPGQIDLVKLRFAGVKVELDVDELKQ